MLKINHINFILKLLSQVKKLTQFFLSFLSYNFKRVNEKEKSKFYKCRESFKDNKGTNLRLRFEHGDLEIMDYLMEISNFIQQFD